MVCSGTIFNYVTLADSGVINSRHEPNSVQYLLQCPFERRTLAEKLKVKELGPDQPNDLIYCEELFVELCAAPPQISFTSRDWVCVCLSVWLVVPATNTVKVKVMRNEVGLRLLCYRMCFPYIYLFVATRHDIKTDRFSKRLHWCACTARLKIKTRCGCFYITVFMKENCPFWCRFLFRKCSMSFSFHLACYMPDKAAFVRSALLCVQRLPRKPLFLLL